MQTIFVTASLPMMVRNWLRTGILYDLSKKVRVVLLTPWAEDLNFVKNFSAENLIIEPLPFAESFTASLGRRLFFIASTRRFLADKKVDTVFFKEQMLKQTRFCYFVFRSTIGFLNRKRIVEKLGWYLWKNYWKENKSYSELFEKYKPIAILSTHPYLETEWPLLYHGEKRKIPLLAFIHSWDNPTSRGELFFKFEKIMVWSEFMKDRLTELHSWIEPEKIVITGAPQYDFFARKDLIEPRESFFGRHNLDPQKKLIVFASGGPLFSSEPEIIKIIINAIEKKDISCPAQLWIRFYGKSSFKSDLSLEKYDQKIVFEEAPEEFWGTFRIERKWKGKNEDLINYLNLLFHSSLVVCSATTVSLDAFLFNKPVINPALDIFPKDFLHSVKKHYFGFSHYQRIVRSGAVRLAMTEKELINYINEYLKNPYLCQETIQNLISEICGPVDGRTSNRIVSTILKTISQ